MMGFITRYWHTVHCQWVIPMLKNLERLISCRFGNRQKLIFRTLPNRKLMADLRIGFTDELVILGFDLAPAP